jgi:hypothetical protein
MTVRIADSGCIELVGACPSEDAEPLLQLLLADRGATVDWRDCRSAHTAVVQVLMAVAPKLLGPPADDRLKDWVAPAVTGAPE